MATRFYDLRVAPLAQPTMNCCWWTAMRMILAHFGHGYAMPSDYCEAFRSAPTMSADPNFPATWYHRGIPPTSQAMRLFSGLIHGRDSVVEIHGEGIHPVTKRITLRGARSNRFWTVDHGVQGSFRREQILTALRTHGPFMVIRRTPSNWAHVVVVTGIQFNVENPDRDTTRIMYADPDGGLIRSSSEREFLQVMCDFTGIFGRDFPLSLRGQVSAISPTDVTV